LTLLAVLAAGAAWAQNYVVTTSPMPYVPITGGTSQLNAFGSTTADDASITVPIGFSFPYYGTNYTQILINSNGFASFTTGVCTFGCNSAISLPSTTRTPHLVIAPWWDDNQFNRPGSSGTDVITRSTPTQFDVEWKNVNAYSGSGFTYELTYKLTLYASGIFQVHYGPFSGSGGSAVAGFEDATGAMGAAFPLPQPGGTACSANSTCTLASFPTNNIITVGQPVQPDLVVQSVNLGSVTKNGTQLSLTISPTFKNFGQNTATGFFWRAWLSADRVYDASDILVLDSTTPLTCAGSATVSDTASATITAPPNGNYYVLVRADSTNVVDEGPYGENNNDGTTANYFVSGLDLVATSVTGPTMSGPGNSMTVHVNWFNQGTDAAGNVDFGIFLSTDNMWSSNDYPLFTGTRNVSGGQTFDEDVVLTVPQNVPGGDFFYVLKIDPNSMINESKTNNVAVSTGKVTVRQADLVIKSVDFVDPASGVSIRHGVFGSTGRMLITASNEGGADARNFKVGVVISADTNLSLLQDTLLIEFPVMQILQGTTVTIDIPFTLPELDRTMRPFATGNWFFFGLLDSSQVITELNENNNNMMVGQPILVSAPAPDLTVVRFDCPSAVGVGEVAPVYRVFKNIGNRAASDVRYQYYVSANAEITTDDTPVQIITGSTATDYGTVALPMGASDATTEFIQIPSTLTPGTYYLGAVIDSDSKVTELDETNNSLGSTGVTVAPLSLHVSTSSLPDAVVGRPYSFQLSVAGDMPGVPTTWAIDTTQGALPAGLMLSSSGLLSGTPTLETVVGITVTATNNMHTAQARLALRVLPTTTQVEITTPSLPSMVNSTMVTYETWLGAAGGVKPYNWRLVPVDGEALPRNLSLGPDGHLAGVPATGIAEKAYPITVEVRDSLGTLAQRHFNLRVVAPGAIIFTNLNIPDGLVGASYTTDIGIRNFDMSPLAKPLTYRLISGALPDGVAMMVEQDVLLLEGTPAIAGTFAFTLEVEDAKGRNDSADFLMRVYPAGLKITANDLPTALVPGDPADFAFAVAGASGVTFKVFSGTLPPGTMLGTDGHVTGTVAAQDSEGTYNFVVEATDSTGATGIGAFSVLVKRHIAVKGCGCSSGSGGAWLVLALAGLALRPRRKTGLTAR
jgi:MYXO-CTERM domain-containing protein